MPAPDEPLDEEKIFQIAAALPAAERDAYLGSACEGHPEMRAECERLLASMDDDAFMQKPVERTVSPDLEAEFARLKPEEAGDVIGNYKLLQQIGEGGFGVVWMAEQGKPVRRRVALKIIKLGMDTKEVIARFEQERQALAIMDHPNIARVFDAGATPFGRPYFVMELVRGVKITEYCDQANLSTGDRLRLFIAVCQAIQHAHQKGIIHRDLKPSNILVTLHDGVPVPKVIDFGVAKATQQQRLTDLTLFTQFEQMIGTPLYMSPEQAELSGLDIDTRSDIYSLGVLLYELLTGRTPFDPEKLMKAGYDEMRRVIREEEPQKPSTFVSTMAVDLRTTVAKHRGAEGAKLIGQIRGDLDWIVMKALEKDRNRRYETASGFARDIERHLASEPVQARPPSQLYRFRRFARRNKVVFAASAAVAVALLAGLAVSTWQAVRANAALAELRASAPAFAAHAHWLAGKERFNEAIEKLEYAIKLRPDAAEYVIAKADLLECQFRFRDAAVFYRQALRLDPASTRAQTNLALCDKLQAEQVSQPNLSRNSLVKLFDTMAQDHRSAAEMLPVGRLLGDNQLVLAMWLERLKELPAQPKRPLEQLLTMGADGMLDLDLSGTPGVDLKLLIGMPVAALSLGNCTDLTDLRPLEGLPLKSLNLQGTTVSDLGPMRRISTLTRLNLAKTKVRDLSPLQGLRLQSLDVSESLVTDLSPLRGMSLKTLGLWSTQVSDLSPLAGMALLSDVDCSSIPAHDFSPLANKPIELLSLQQTRVIDLSFLKGMPLRQLVLAGCRKARGFQVLNEIRTLELLYLPVFSPDWSDEEIAAISKLREHPVLSQVDTGEGMGGMRFVTAGPKERFWRKWDANIRLMQAARDAGARSFRKSELADGTMDLFFMHQPLRDLEFLRGSQISVLDIDRTLVTDFSLLAELPLRKLLVRETALSDLSFLRGSRCGSMIQELWLWRTKITDFSPLAECSALQVVDLYGTAIMNLEPLRGLKLKTLFLGSTRVSDLSPLAGVPLETFYFDGTDVTDIAPLLQCPTLEKIILPRGVQNVSLLRALPKLRKIGYQNSPTDHFEPSLTADEFWRAFEATNLVREGKLKDAEKVLRKQVEVAKQIERDKGIDRSKWQCSMEWMHLASVILASGDKQSFRNFCREIFDFFAGTTDATAAGRVAKVCLYVPDSGIPLLELEPLLKISGADPSIRESPWASLGRGMWEFRSANYATAVETLTASKNDPRGTTANAQPFLPGAVASPLLAMAHFYLGKTEAAKAELELSRQTISSNWPLQPTEEWYIWMLVRMLTEEAEALITISSVTKDR